MALHVGCSSCVSARTCPTASSRSWSLRRQQDWWCRVPSTALAASSSDACMFCSLLDYHIYYYNYHIIYHKSSIYIYRNIQKYVCLRIGPAQVQSTSVILDLFVCALICCEDSRVRDFFFLSLSLYIYIYIHIDEYTCSYASTCFYYLPYISDIYVILL